MKKILFVFSLPIFLIASPVFAITYRDEIKYNLNPLIENTTNNINSAELIEKYLVNLKNEIETFNVKYNINGDTKLNSFLNTIEKMILSMKKIQTYSIEKQNAEDIMKSVINELKTLNPKIKSYLKLKKNMIEIETTKTKGNYIKLSQKLSKNLSLFINEIYKNNKDNAEINKHLKVLSSENNKLLNFKNIQFDNPSEVKNRFLIILSNIKNEFFEIKKILKK